MQATGTGLDWHGRLEQGIRQATELADRFGVSGQLREQAASMLASRVGVPQESLDAVIGDAGKPGSTERLSAMAGQSASAGEQQLDATSEAKQGQADGGEGGKVDLNSVKDVAATAASVASADPRVKAAIWALQQVDLDKAGEKLGIGQGKATAEGSQKPEAARELLTQTATDPQAREAVLAQMRDDPEFRRSFMHEAGAVMDASVPRLQHASDQSAAANMAGEPDEKSDQSHGPRPV